MRVPCVPIMCMYPQSSSRERDSRDPKLVLYCITYTHMRSAADNAREHISRLLACWCVCSGYLLWDAGPAHGPGSMPHNGLWTRMPTHSERAIERHTNESGSILETGYHWVQIFVCDGSSAIRLRILVTYSNVTFVKEFCQLSINILKLESYDKG